MILNIDNGISMVSQQSSFIHILQTLATGMRFAKNFGGIQSWYARQFKSKYSILPNANKLAVGW